jgi:hypothetical protein
MTNTVNAAGRQPKEKIVVFMSLLEVFLGSRASQESGDIGSEACANRQKAAKREQHKKRQLLGRQ